MDFTYEQEIVDRAKRLSVDINDYFEEHKYKQFMDDNAKEEVTDRYLMNVAVELVLDELKDMGIESDQTADDMIEDPTQMETMFALRTKFDQEYFYETLKSFSSKSIADFQTMYENIELPEDLLMELGPWMAERNPEDPMWSLIYHSVNTWYSTEYFADTLKGVLTRLYEETDPNAATVDDTNVGSVTRFLSKMEQNQIKLRLYADKLYKEFQIEPLSLEKAIKNYDRSKLTSENLPLFAMYEDIKPDKEPDFVKLHKQTTNHHVEYWVYMSKRSKEVGVPMPVYTKTNAVMIVLSMVLDGASRDTMVNLLSPLKPIIPQDMYDFTVTLASFNYNNTNKEVEHDS